MKTFAALVLKDLRAVRGWIGVTWLFIAASLLFPQRRNLWEPDWPERGSWLTAVACITIVFMQRSLLAIDPPLGDRRFMGTRPAWGSAVLGSKVLVILMAGILPVALAAAVRLWGAGLGVTAEEGLLVAFEDSLFLLCLLGFLTLRHVLPGYSRWAAALGIIASLITLVFGRAMSISVPAYESPDFYPVAMAVTLAFVLWAALAGKYAQSRWWMRLVSMALAAAAMAATMFALRYAHQTGVPDTAPPPAGIHPALEQKAYSWSCGVFSTESAKARQDENGNDSAWLEFRREVKVKNLPPGVWLDQTLSEGTLRINREPDERGFRLVTAGMASWSVPPQAAAGALPGAPSLTTPWDGLFLPIAQVMIHDVKKGVPFKVSLRGRHHFDVYRAELVTLLPIKEGLVWSGGHLRLEFAVVMGVPRVEARLWVRGDVFDRHSGALSNKLSSGVNELGFYGINFPAQRLMLMGGDPMGDETFAWQRRTQVGEDWGFGMGTYRWVLPGETPPADERAEEKEKLDHGQTQIGIFRRIKIGSVVVPFEIVDQVLTPK